MMKREGNKKAQSTNATAALVGEDIQDDVFLYCAKYVSDRLKVSFKKYERLLEVQSSKSLRSGVVIAVTKYWLLADSVHRLSPKKIRKETAEKQKVAYANMLAIDKILDAQDRPSRLHEILTQASDRAFFEWWRLAERQSALPVMQPGRPQSEASETFVHDIASIYEKITGSHATITTDPYSDKYTGNFITFLKSVDDDAKNIIEKIDPDLLKHISKSIQRYAKKEKLTTPSRISAKD